MTIKERPILMNGDMVRAVLAGKKTQTRRVIKPQPEQGFDWPEESFGDGWQWLDAPGDDDMANFWPSYQQGLHCPFGAVGDRLWVRETFREIPQMRPSGYWSNPKLIGKNYWYRATDCLPTWGEGPWYPSIHMRKEASRITLEITDVRVQRVKDASDSDIAAEGVEPDIATDHPRGVHYTAWQDLWQSIYGNESWYQNPWVWAITFKKIEAPK